ncbi:hypothetical protein GQX74_012677 [Glossina fuscipes]|nr:hypothetical protein GQX74_012677 [Glossina fuscipes]
MLHYQSTEQFPQQRQQQQQEQQQRSNTLLRVYHLHLNAENENPPFARTNNETKIMKTLAPNIRRRRRCERHHLELYHGTVGNDKVSSPTTELIPKSKSASTSPINELLSGIPAPPITPPPAFLPIGYKRSTQSSKIATVKRSLDPTYVVSCIPCISNSNQACADVALKFEKCNALKQQVRSLSLEAQKLLFQY